MGDEITSHGQQGGITAGEVNIGGSPDPPVQSPVKKSRWKVVAGIVAGIVAFIAAVAGILTALGLLPLQGG